MRIVFSILVLLCSTWAHSITLNKVVVFGDSLSDNGNLYEYMKKQLPMSPPYFEGRFTNGPVWVERLVSQYYPQDAKAHLLDYAFGGAGVLEDEDDYDEDDALFTLQGEVDNYLLSHHGYADASSLYVVWMGSNNYLAIPEDEDKAVSATNQGIVKELNRLVDRGAKHIIVVNVPDLGKTPAARDFDAVDTLTSLSSKHNAMLLDNITTFKQTHPEVQWLYFDVNTIVNEMILHPERYGIYNVTDTCYEEAVDRSAKRKVLSMASKVQFKVKNDRCKGYLFFDPVHPSNVAHQLMADKIKEILDAQNITLG